MRRQRQFGRSNVDQASRKSLHRHGHGGGIDEPLQLANEIASFVGKLAPKKSFQDREAWTLNFQETSDVDKDSKASDF
jgi:hypothetical protein